MCSADSLLDVAAGNLNTNYFTSCNCTSGYVNQKIYLGAVLLLLTGSIGHVDSSKKWISSKAVVIVLLICVLLTTLAFTASVACYVYRRDKCPVQGPLFSSDKDTSFSSATNLISHGASSVPESRVYIGRKRLIRARGHTLGKGVQKRIARKKGEKLHVYVNRVLNAITGGNATPATNELRLQIRRLCPLQSLKSWRKIDQSTKDAVIQAMLDKFVIGDDFDNDEQAQQILDRKANLLYKDWRYNLKQEFLELEEKGVDDPYSHPPSGVSLDDWKYLIDVAWKDESHLKRSKAGKANRGMLPYNHTSGSRSFPIAMANEDGEIDFPEFYKKSHKSKKTRDWIDPKCGELHDDMVNLHVVATDAGLPLTYEELSRQEKKNYLRGCGIGLQPSSTVSSAARARDKHMESMRAELEVLREEHQRDHEELLKEKEERQRDHEELVKEKKERQRDREEIMRERNELMKQIEEGKKARKAQQVQLNHLNDVVSRLTTLLQGSDGHPTIR
ncbi:hypothetical protein TEA_003975 [Camellia sinensis var. sinensis]|uniref:WH2 domain-containing protein n=1 Tax=Camellia sinensis var. sinensis TaxID=542762 RepID=A0A4V3WK78_CAMSN|nr:hypothetical protein TEA_003975 [Camellia sinensis var. sinensis]